MPDPTQRLTQMKRPKLLITAARYGLRHYNRDRVLTRLLGRLPHRASRAMDALLAQEADVERTRQKGAADYSPAAHIDLLTAIMAEAQDLTEAQPPQL